MAVTAVVAVDVVAVAFAVDVVAVVVVPLVAVAFAVDAPAVEAEHWAIAVAVALHAELVYVRDSVHVELAVL